MAIPTAGTRNACSSASLQVRSRQLLRTSQQQNASLMFCARVGFYDQKGGLAPYGRSSVWAWRSVDRMNFEAPSRRDRSAVAGRQHITQLESPKTTTSLGLHRFRSIPIGTTQSLSGEQQHKRVSSQSSPSRFPNVAACEPKWIS